MCLGLPGLVTDVNNAGPAPMATVDFGGAQREVCLLYIPDAAVGDYVVVHAGFAISLLDEAAAKASLDLFAEIGIVEPEAVDQ